MPSIIPRYENDIFISYRQKDNRQDGWVTEFVEQLKWELEATFKEDISVYFDINPHDGLLETHDVAASLKEKLKALIFIPIISRTYCDPKSYAWEHEFLQFIEQASQDRFGLKVKLPNGNVASRVLPVRIHDLDSEDKELFESHLGFIRPVDFIYSARGVNRPLRRKDDDLDKTGVQPVYRDQVNRVANAVRELISGMKSPPEKAEPESENKGNSLKGPAFHEKSIIVLPFENISPDPEQEYFSDGLTEEIITDLSHIHGFLVISRSSAMTFKKSNKTIPEIARSVNVHYVLEGSVRKAGNSLRITAQLIDATNDVHLWAEKYNGSIDDVFDIQEKVSRSIADALRQRLTPEENYRIGEKPISDITAFQYYLRARHDVWSFDKEKLDAALRLTDQALAIAGDNALLFATRALIHWQYHNSGIIPHESTLVEASAAAEKALQLDPNLPQGHLTMGAIAYTQGNLLKALISFKRSAELETGGEALSWVSGMYGLIGKMEDSRKYSDRAIEVDPLNILALCLRGLLEIYDGEFLDSIDWFKRGLDLLPDDPMSLLFYGVVLLYAGQKEQSIDLFNRMSTDGTGIMSAMANMWLAGINADAAGVIRHAVALEEYGSRDKEISWLIADSHAMAGQYDKALHWVRNAVELGFINTRFFANINPNLAPLRNDPHFQMLMEKAGKQQILMTAY